MKLLSTLLVKVVPWMIIAAFLIAYLTIPDSYWLEYKKFHVENTAQGSIPKVALDKEYHRTVDVSWTMVIYRSDQGRFWPVCRVSGDDRRAPGAYTPVDLSFWFDGQSDCIRQLAPSDYYAEEIVRWWGYFRHREVIMDSNTFTVTAPD